VLVLLWIYYSAQILFLGAEFTEVYSRCYGSRRVPGGGFRRFVGESAAELKKVEWPNRRQLFTATVVVIIAIAVVGAYLWVADLAFASFVKDVLLNL